MIGAGGNIRRIYQIANTLFGRDGDRPLPEDATQAMLAAIFQISFSEKIDAFCCSMNQPPVDDVATNTTALLVRFEAASPTDVKNVILISAAKSCELDPLLNIATMKARQCISPHCSIVTRHAGPSLCPWFVLVHTALYEGTPVYLASLLHRHTPRRTLRSGGGLLLNVSSVNLERYGQQAFAGPTLWNSLPLELRANENIRQFKKLLETFCFQINILK